MKVITGNALNDGRVIYLGADDHWVDLLSDAVLLTEDNADDVLARAQLRSREVADLYLIDVAESRLASGRDALKETIRSHGPTVRLDLGKQASFGKTHQDKISSGDGLS